MIEKYQARVIGCYPVPTGERQTVLLQVAFPYRNFETSFAMILTAMVGNDVSTALRVKLIDLGLIGAAKNAFSGPHFGMDGLRRLVGVEDRPLILNMLKPCIGYPPEVGAELFYQSGIGGVDLIKDDELMGNTKTSDVIGRVKAYSKAAQKVYNEIGRAPLYLVNITDRPERMREHARAAFENGAKAVMVNFVVTGLDSLAALTEEFGTKLLFLAHFAGFGIASGEGQGIGIPVLLGKLPRLAGADGVLVMNPSDHAGSGYLEFLQTIQAHCLPMGNLRRVFTVVGGGVTPLTVAKMYRDLGKDVVFAVGGAIQGHPGGSPAGARAMLRAVEAAVQGIELSEAAQDSPELRQALELWDPDFKK